MQTYFQAIFATPTVGTVLTQQQVLLLLLLLLWLVSVFV